MKYVQPFTEGLSRLLENSAGNFGPTLAISHFLPLYIPSLYNDEYGGSFAELFNKDFNIAVSGIKCEPIWLPTETVHYEYVATPQNKIVGVVNVSDIPVSASVSVSSTNAVWENAYVSGDNMYTFSKVSGGLTGIDGWLFENNMSFFDYSSKLKAENLFPIKDYEAFTDSSENVCGRYIVGFKDIADKLGISKDSDQYGNIYNSRFVYNAVVLYGFKIIGISQKEDNQISYEFDTTPYPVAIAGIEGQPVAINMDSMNNSGSEWDSVWNIDLNFVPFDAGSGITNITSRIVSEKSYWTKNNPYMIHTNNKLHVGMTVEPYGDTISNKDSSAWLHISNKNVDPSKDASTLIDRRHIRLDASKSFSTVEHKDVGEKGVLEIKTYTIDSYQTGLNTVSDRSPFIQAHGATAYGEQDAAIGPGIIHSGNKHSISFGNYISVSGNIENTIIVGAGVEALNTASGAIGNIISIGNNGADIGKNVVKVGNEKTTKTTTKSTTKSTGVVNVGDNNSSYKDFKNAVIIGNENSFNEKIGNADHTNAKSLLIIGNGNLTSLKDSTNDESFLENGQIVGDGNVVSSVESNIHNFSINGNNSLLTNSSNELNNITITGDGVNVTASGGSNIEIVGNNFKGTVNNNIKVFGSNASLSYIDNVNIFGNDFVASGSLTNSVSVGNKNSTGVVSVWFNNITNRSATNFTLLGNSINVGGGDSAVFVGTKISGNSTIRSIINGYEVNYNTTSSSILVGERVTPNMVDCGIFVGDRLNTWTNYTKFSNKMVTSYSVIVGRGINIEVTSNALGYDGQMLYGTSNSVVVGSNIELKDPYNSLFVGNFINCPGYKYSNNMAIGENIELHAGAAGSHGGIFAIGSNITFGANGVNLANKVSSKNKVFVFGDSFKSTDYYSTDILGNYTVTKSPIAIFANNNVGNKTFKSIASDTFYGVKIGKYISKFDDYTDGSSSVDGPENWKCPHGGFTSLSNSTVIDVQLPVLMQNSVFGKRYGSRGEYITYELQERNPLENVLFVDENGYVRQMSRFHMENPTFDLNTTVRSLYSNHTFSILIPFMDKFKEVVTHFKNYFNATSYANARHRHLTTFNKSTQYKQIDDLLVEIYGSVRVNNYGTDQKEACDQFVRIFTKIRDNVGRMFNSDLILLNNHTPLNHELPYEYSIDMVPKSFTLDFNSSINGSYFYKLYNWAKGLEYYVLHCVVGGSDGYHRHLPCTIDVNV